MQNQREGKQNPRGKQGFGIALFIASYFFSWHHTKQSALVASKMAR